LEDSGKNAYLFPPRADTFPPGPSTGLHHELQKQDAQTNLVHCIARVTPEFVYDQSVQLTDVQQKQYDCWCRLNHGLDRTMTGKLHFYSVHEVYALPTPVESNRLYGMRGLRSFWKQVPEYASALFEHLDGKPEWLRRGGCPELSVSLPYTWAALLSHNIIKDFCILNKFPCARANWFGWRATTKHAWEFISTEW